MMESNPLNDVVEEGLNIDRNVIDALAVFRTQPKLQYLPGEDVTEERTRLEFIVNELIGTLIEGVAAHPSKLWVMKEFQKSLELVWREDTEAREHFGGELEAIMGILAIESSDGLLACYLGGV
jgi:hypothetical protein